MTCLILKGCLVSLILICWLPKQTWNLGVIGGTHAEISCSFFAFVGRGDNTCGGALTQPDVVVTAASCLYDRKRQKWPSAEQIYILHGCFKSEMNVKYYSCEQYLVHYLFNPRISEGPLPYDMALVKLERGVDKNENFARPCRYNLASERDNYRFGTLIGLGLTNQNPDIKPQGLMQAVLQKSDSCGEYEKNGYRVNKAHQVCYSVPGLASACVGDTGSPLLYKDDGNTICLLGIASYSFQKCDHPDYPTVFTSVEGLRGWMRKSLHLFKIKAYLGETFNTEQDSLK